MTTCRKCGETKFVAQYKVTGTIFVTENFNGSTAGCDNTEMWNYAHLSRTKDARRCYNCDTILEE